MEARMLTHKQVAEVLGIPKAAFSRAVYTIHRFGMDAFKQKHVVEKLS
jgi:predicted XRE-type DNA-binding protein